MFAELNRTLVVAEVGSNHGGSLDAALALIDAAADAGADAAKFQAGHADHVYDPTQYPDEHASFKKYVEPVLDWLPQLANRCEERGIDFGCSAFCFDALDAVDPWVKWHKVASIEATWTDYLKAVAAKGKPMIVSTGALVRDDVECVLDTVSGWDGPEVVLMQCAVAYPADMGTSDLRAVADLGGAQLETMSALVVGLSDHTTHPTIAPCAAVALGAKVIEKHLRLNLRGDVPSAILQQTTPDWPHSIDQHQFGEMVRAIRLTEQALGSGEKRIRESERPFLRYRRGPKGLRGE